LGQVGLATLSGLSTLLRIKGHFPKSTENHGCSAENQAEIQAAAEKKKQDLASSHELVGRDI
jgi:hypothetical protein